MLPQGVLPRLGRSQIQAPRRVQGWSLLVGAEQRVFALCVAAYLVFFLGWLLGTRHGNQYSALAEAMLHGRLDVVGFDGSDVTLWNGRDYLPVPFLPSLALLPVVAIFGPGTYESLVGALVGIANLIMFRHLLRRWDCPAACRPWLLLLFGLGSLHFAAVAGGGNWLFSHLLATTVLLALLLELFGRDRPWVIGLLIGAATLIRPSTAFVLLLPPLALWARGVKWQRGVGYLVRVAMGGLPVAGVWLWYNWARFGEPWQSGYGMITVPPCLAGVIEAHGLRSLAYLPRNLMLTFLNPPAFVPGDGALVRRWGDVGAGCTSLPATASAAPLAFPYVRPSEWGMGLLLTTPALIWSVLAPWRDRWVKSSWALIFASLAISGTYASSGWIQFGARYTLDFLPFALLLIVRAMPQTPPRVFRWLVVASVVVECWGIALTTVLRNF